MATYLFVEKIFKKELLYVLRHYARMYHKIIYSSPDFKIIRLPWKKQPKFDIVGGVAAVRHVSFDYISSWLVNSYRLTETDLNPLQESSDAQDISQPPIKKAKLDVAVLRRKTQKELQIDLKPLHNSTFMAQEGTARYKRTLKL
jgi:hypothetical protein